MIVRDCAGERDEQGQEGERADGDVPGLPQLRSFPSGGDDVVEHLLHACWLGADVQPGDDPDFGMTSSRMSRLLVSPRANTRIPSSGHSFSGAFSAALAGHRFGHEDAALRGE